MTDTLPDGSADLLPEAGIYTETLARLYLRQGFLDRAVGIYRHLTQEQPENQRLQTQLQALEQQLQQGGVERETEPARAPVALPPPASTPCRAAPTVIAQLERWLRYLQRQQPRC